MKVRGKDVNIYVRVGSDWVVAGCATSCTLNVTADVIPTTTADSGRDRTVKGGARNAELTLSGVVTLNETSMWQYEDWMDNYGEVLRVLFEMTDEGGSQLAYDMNALVTNVSNSAPADNYDVFDVSMVRSGAMTKVSAIGVGGIGVMEIGTTFIVA
jgi:hypothetical protein